MVISDDLKRSFWERVEVRSAGECWPWLGVRHPSGRGVVSVMVGSKRTTTPAPRVMWTLEKGPIPSGLSALHTCDNPNCVNPDHLWLGTQADNMRDAAAKGRKKWPEWKLATHCKHGHPLEGDNLRITPAGKRACRACNRERVARHLKSKRAEYREKGLNTRGEPLSWGWRLRLGKMLPS